MRRSPLVLGVLAALMAATVAASAWWVIGESRHAIVEQVQRSEVLAADERASSLTETLQVATERMAITASAPGVQGAMRERNPSIIGATASFYLSIPGVTGVAIRASDGSTLAAAGRPITTPVDEAITYRSNRDRTAAFGIFSAPIDDLGWVQAEFSLTTINPQLRMVFREFEGNTALLRRDGTVLLSTTPMRSARVENPELRRLLATGQHGRADLDSPEMGGERIVVVSPVDGTDLMVAVGAAAEIANAPAQALATRLAIAFLVTLAMVATLGSLASLVLRSSRRALEEVRRASEELARTDPLTGLANRRAFDTTVVELEAHRRSAAVVLVDIDDLKAINDGNGHAAGDEALRRTADAIRSVVRPTDLVARIGGDEFVIVLPETSAWRAGAVADDVRAAIAAIDLAGFGSLSASTGVDAATGDLTHALARADALLYEAKRARAGR